MPLTSSLRFVLVEFSLEVGTVGVNPFALDELSIFEVTNVFFTGFVHNVGSFSLFLAVAPIA